MPASYLTDPPNQARTAAPDVHDLAAQAAWIVRRALTQQPDGQDQRRTIRAARDVVWQLKEAIEAGAFNARERRLAGEAGRLLHEAAWYRGNRAKWLLLAAIVLGDLAGDQAAA